MEPKRLIVNADEFGLTAGVNRGVLRAGREGLVRSASLLVNAPGTADAVAAARNVPQLGLGLQLAFTGLAPLLSALDVPSLVDGRGRFPRDGARLPVANPAEVLLEARAQYRRFRELVGRMPTHLDTRQHVHSAHPVFDALLTLAWETGLPVRALGVAMRLRLREEGIPTTDDLIDVFQDADVAVKSVVQALARLGPGTAELCCRPGEVDAELRRQSDYVGPREGETAVLCDPAVRVAANACGLELVSFDGLKG